MNKGTNTEGQSKALGLSVYTSVPFETESSIIDSDLKNSELITPIDIIAEVAVRRAKFQD